MGDKEIKEGDQVSWQWSGSRPGGTVAEVAEKGDLEITTNKGNTVKKNASPDDPAVHIERSGNDVVKRAHELDVEKEGDKHKEAQGEEKTVGEDDKEKAQGEENGSKEAQSEEKTAGEDDKEDSKEQGEENNGEDEKKGEEEKDEEEAQAGDKRSAKDGEEDGEPSSKKQKTEDAGDDAGDDGGDKKKRGRPTKNGNGSAAAKPKKEPKKAATETGQPRRSSRLNSS